ncbi:MAG: hypothetical protein M0R40_07155 [Firmicutes bacterium]|nr:hypothetical protein [Bacillota bacterium]
MREQDITNYWQYFLCLEGDLSEASRYAEPMGQPSVYSFEYYKIITLACAETETVFKLICKKIDANESPRCITDYAKIILRQYPQIIDTKVIVSRINETIKPFEEWTIGKCTFWWDEHQDIKHNRHMFFKKATYKNALYSLAGLYVLLLYLYKISTLKLPNESKYFYNDAVCQYLCCKGSGELPDFAQ